MNAFKCSWLRTPSGFLITTDGGNSVPDVPQTIFNRKVRDANVNVAVYAAVLREFLQRYVKRNFIQDLQDASATKHPPHNENIHNTLQLYLAATPSNDRK